jgi:hypothetical protein
MRALISPWWGPVLDKIGEEKRLGTSGRSTVK